MKKLLLGVFVGLLILGITAPVWALEVTVGGEFRFRARQRTDFDLQAFNLNGGPRTFSTDDIVTWDAPVGQLTYGGNPNPGLRPFGGANIGPYAIWTNGQVTQGWAGGIGTGFGPLQVLNNSTGQYVNTALAPFTLYNNRSWVNDGTAAEENFGYAAAIYPGPATVVRARLNSLRPSANGVLVNNAIQHLRELARPHADVGNNDRDYLYDRIRVSVDAKIVEGLRAYVMFENYSDWGLSSSTAANEPRVFGGNGSAGIYGDRQGLNIRFAWVDFVIPKTPIHVKIGRQPIALGHGILLDTRTWGGDMAYVYAPIGPVTLGALYGKLVEGNIGNSEDATFWGLHADFAINPSNKVSTYYRYVWSRLGRYANNFPNVAPGALATSGAGVIGAPANSNHKYDANQHAWGISFDGRIPVGKASIFYAAEVDILWGQYTDWVEPRSRKPYGYWDYLNARTPLQQQEDLYQVAWGYGLQLGVDLKWVKLDVAHSYGSGDKTRASNTRFTAYDGAWGVIGNPWVGGGAGMGTQHHQWTTGRRVEAFDAWGGDNGYSPWATDIFMASGKSAGFGGVGLGTAGFTRRWGYTGDFGDLIMVKPTLTVKPLDNLTADISYAAFWKTSNTNSNGAGANPVVDGEFGTQILWKSNLNNREQPNKQSINPFLGQEINSHLTWYPYKNLMIKGWAGVFFPGEWFKVQQRQHNADNIGAFSTVSTGHDSVGLKPAWAMQLDVIVTF